MPIPKPGERKRKKRVAYSKKVCDFICEQVQKGHTVAEICDRLYPNDTPDSQTVYSWRHKYPEFDEKLHKSYETFFYRKIEELEYITQQPLSVLYPDLEFKEGAEARRARIDCLKFELGKLAPVLARKTFNTKQEIEVKGDTGPQIHIVSYATPELKDLNALEDKKEDE